MKRAIRPVLLCLAMVGVLATSAGADGPVGRGGITCVQHDGTLTGCGTSSSLLSAIGSLSGSGTAGLMPVWTSGTSLGNSGEADNGSTFSINNRNAQAIRAVGAGFTSANPSWDALDTTAFTTGVGGSIIFEGNYNGGGSHTALGGIKALKENSTSGDFGGDLWIGARQNGSGDLSGILMLRGSDSSIFALVQSGGFYVEESTTPTATMRMLTSSGQGYLEVGTSTGTSAAPFNLTSMNGGTTYASWDSSGNMTAAHQLTVAAQMTLQGTLDLNNSTGDDYIATGQALGGAGNSNLNLYAGGTGAIVLNPNTGSVANAGTGGVKLIAGGNSSTTVWAVTNGGASTQIGTLQALRILSETQRFDFTRGFEFFDDFANVNSTAGQSWATQNAQSMISASSTANHPGLVTLGVTNGTNSVAAFWRGGTGNAKSWIAGGGITDVGWEETAPDVTKAATLMGMEDADTGGGSPSTTPANGIYCKAPISGTNWQVCTTKASTSTCASTSPVVAITAGDWVRCQWEINAAGTSVAFTVTDVTTSTTGTATSTTNIPVLPVGLATAILENGTNTTSVSVDWAWAHETFTTAR